MRQWWTVEGFFLGLVALAFILVTVYPMRDSKDDDAETQKNGILKTLGSDEGLEAPLSCDAAAELEAADAAGEHQPAGPDSGNRVLMAPGVIHLRKAATRVERFLQPLFDLGTYVSNACGDGSGPEPSPGAVTCCVSAVSVIPAALIVVILGIVLAMIAYPSVLSALSLGPSRPQVVVPSSSDWRTGILRAGLPQLALTAFNSVISVCQLSAQLFPDRPARPSSVATSVGLMNLVGCWFGAMPCCHGSGGLASQVRFGARWGTAPIVLGMFKIFLSLLLGSSLFQLLQVFPSPLLGAMLVYAGMELAAVAKGQKTTRGLAIMLITAAITLGINNVAIGVASGLAAAYLLALRDWVVEGASQAVRGTKVLRCCAAPRAAHDEEV